MKFVVIGLGEFGTATALQLSRGGQEVIALDLDMERVERVKNDVAHAVCLDATDDKALLAQGVGDADVLIAAIGSNFEAQVLSVVHARQLGIKRVVARATSVDHRRVLLAVGAHAVISPEEEAARHLVQRFMLPDIERYLELAEGFSIVELRAPEGIVGKTLQEIDLRGKYRLNLVAIVDEPDDGERISRTFDPIPDRTRALTHSDILVLVGADVDVTRFVEEGAS